MWFLTVRTSSVKRLSAVAEFVGGANVLTPKLASALLGIARPVAVRPEQMQILPAGASTEPGWVACPGTIADSQYHGATLRVQVRTGDGELLTVARPEAGGGATENRAGTAVKVAWPRASVVELETERA